MWFCWEIEDECKWKEEACGMNIGIEYCEELNTMQMVSGLMTKTILHIIASEFADGAKQFPHMRKK